MRKNKKFIITGIVVAVIALLFIPKLISSGNQKGDANPRMQSNIPLQIKAHIVKGEILDNNISTSGTVLANEEVELRSEISGKVTKIYFNEGTYVNKSALLVKINDAELQAQLSRAKFRLKLLEDKEYRQKVLLQKEAISQEEYDVALNELNMNKAEVELVEAQLDKTEIKAPFSGRIGLKNISEGSYITSLTIIATLQNINPVKLDFSIPERYASQVKVRNEVKFKVAGDSRTYNGEVYAIEPKINTATRTLQIRALYHNREGNIFPGAFADIELVLEKTSNAFLLPSHALIPELKGQKVFVYKNGFAVPQNVETGIRTDQSIQIISGIKEKDTVIISGILQLKPNAPVRIAEFN